MSDSTKIIERIDAVEQQVKAIKTDILTYAEQRGDFAVQQNAVGDPFSFYFTIFVLACFVGYFVVWKVTPALHTPLMAVTNAISGIIIVGAIIAAGASEMMLPNSLGFFAIILASINIFGGFVVTQRMLKMFKKKER